MSRRHAWSALLLVVACLLALDPGRAGAAPRDPMYGAPEAGACYQVPLSAADKSAAHARTVPCTERHTLWIVGVVEAPESVAFDGSMRFWRFAIRACGGAQSDAIGDQLHRYLRTVYQNFFFLPTKAQEAHGAHWISCELGWLVGNERLVTNRIAAPPRLSADMPDTLLRCMGSFRKQCSKPHQWRASFGRAIGGDYSDAALRRAAQRICPEHTSTRRWTYAGGEFVSLSSYSLTCFERSRR